MSHVTLTPLSGSKDQGHQAALVLTAVLARQAAAAVSVRTCWPWETAATLPSARPREALRRLLREERGRGISWRPPAYSLLSKVQWLRSIARQTQDMGLLDWGHNALVCRHLYYNSMTIDYLAIKVITKMYCTISRKLTLYAKAQIRDDLYF